jgi:hypothetical protein
MASVKVVLWKYRKKDDGSASLAIRITKDRKTQYVHTGEYIQEKNWNHLKLIHVKNLVKLIIIKQMTIKQMS